MTTRRDSRPTWAGWWLIPILTIAWPLVAFAHYPPGNQPMQFTTGGWIAEAIWLLTLATLSAWIAVARHRAATAVNPAPRTVNLTDTLGPIAVNHTDSLTGQPRSRKLTNQLGAASKHKSDVTRSQGAERRPRCEDTPAPPT